MMAMPDLVNSCPSRTRKPDLENAFGISGNVGVIERFTVIKASYFGNQCYFNINKLMVFGVSTVFNLLMSISF